MQNNTPSGNRKRTLEIAGTIALCGLAVPFAAHRLFAATPATGNSRGASAAAAPKAAPRPAPVNNAPLSEDEKIVHVLNRLGFGPRPGDVERVRALGLSRYIDLQLHPDQINDQAVDQQLAPFAMLKLSGDQLSEIYFARNAALRQAQVLNKEVYADKAPDAKADPAMMNGAATHGGTVGVPAMAMEETNAGAGAVGGQAEDVKKKRQQFMANATPEQMQQMRQLRQEVATRQQAVVAAQTQLMTAKTLRAVESERQLQEVMVDFWTNHFNIDARKQQCATLIVADDRDVIRPFALGKFRDLLGADAKSAAMLVYLDNYLSTTPNPVLPGAAAGGGRRQQALRRYRLMQLQQGQALGQLGAVATAAPAGKVPKNAAKRAGGLNENYGREIMELHTLGVDGGYTQKDVTEVARCFTGWGLNRVDNKEPMQPAQRKYGQGGEFQFHPFLHDRGEKVVLGQVIPAGGGVEDGEKVLDILASAPATMQHVSFELCQRFVSDAPPQTLVDRCVATWKRTDGDLREVVRTIVMSPEFYSRDAYRHKIKSPFEFAVSSVRALGGEYDLSPGNIQSIRGNLKKNGGAVAFNNTTLVGQVSTLGEPLFEYQAPTGYPEDSHKWVSSGALISRLNFSLALSGGKLMDIHVENPADDMAGLAQPTQVVNHLALNLLHQSLSPSTQATLLDQAADAPAEAVPASAGATDAALTRRLTALILGSPEFQRR